jgi:hypothetical protein
MLFVRIVRRRHLAPAGVLARYRVAGVPDCQTAGNGSSEERKPIMAGGMFDRARLLQRRGGLPVLRQLALASFILLTPSLASVQAAEFRIEEATIGDIQAAIPPPDFGPVPEE